MRRFWLILAGLLAWGLLAAAPAFAHATVVSSDPLDGARLKTAPSSVTITFDEPVGLGSGGYLRVVDQNGKNVDAGEATHPGGVGSKVTVALRSGLGDSSYTASFRIVSADSHPVAGSIRFVVGNGVLGAAATAPSTVNGTTSTLFATARWVSFGGLALLGGGWLLLTIWPAGRDDHRARTVVWTGWGAAAIGGAAELVLQGPYVAGSGPVDVVKLALLDDTLHTTYGTAHCLRLVLLAALGGLLAVLFGEVRRSRTHLEEAAALLGLGVAATFAVVGHGSTQSPAWLSETSDALHLSAMAVWLGGLVIVCGALLPRYDSAEAAAVLPRFSRVAFGAVVVLAVTGTYQAWRGVGSWHALGITSYGRLVLIKVALFVLILGVANVSRRAVQARDLQGRTVVAELGLAAAVLVATAVLVNQPPGKAAVALSEAKPRSAVVVLGAGRTATVTVSSGRHGTVGVTVSLSAGAAQAVQATATLPAKELGPISLPLTAEAGGTYSASGVLLPGAGAWVFALTVQTSQFDAVTASTIVKLA